MLQELPSLSVINRTEHSLPQRQPSPQGWHCQDSSGVAPKSLGLNIQHEARRRRRRKHGQESGKGSLGGAGAACPRSRLRKGKHTPLWLLLHLERHPRAP